MREFLIFYSSFYESAQYLPEADKLKFYEAVIEYGLLEKEPDLQGLAKGMFVAVRPVIDAGIKRRVNGQKNGQKGGRPKKTPEIEEVPVKKKTTLVRPKIEEIREYVKEKGYHIDAEQFFNFYESKGWKIGKDAMKNWHSAVATWEKRYLDEHPAQKPRAVKTEVKEEDPNERAELIELLKGWN